MRSKSILLGLAAALFLGVPAAMAQAGSPVATVPAPGETVAGNPFAERGATLPAVVRWLQSESIPLVFIGDEGGVKGYLGEAANGRYQTFYAAPDGDHVMTGILYQSGGRHKTRDQVAHMLQRFNEAATRVPDADLSSLTDVPEFDDQMGTEDRPIMDYFRSEGLKVTDLNATEGGVRAFLVETQPAADGSAGKMQMFYVLPNDRYAVAGVLLRRGGVNVTGLQIGYLQQSFINQQRVSEMSGSQISTGPRAPDVPKVDPSAAGSTVPETLDMSQLLSQAQEAIEANQAAVLPVPSVVQPPAVAADAPVVPTPVFSSTPISAKAVDASDPFKIADVTGDDFIKAANQTVYFSVGLAGRPAIYMVADPQCPFCHEAWRTLKTLVFDGKIQVRVIMIAGLRGSDPLARSILSHEDPSGVWLAGQGSIQGTRIDPPPAVGTEEWNRAGQFLQINSGFIRQFNITQTPFLAYVTPEGQLYANRGVPTDFDAFLAALR